MELVTDDQLQILTEKTWDLHVRISDKINQNGFSFCGHCSNQGRYCVVAESTVEEREKMTAIRDSLRDVHDILIFLQRAKANQKRQRDDALARLEESRRVLIERIDQFPQKERKPHVLQQLIAFLGDGKAQFTRSLTGKMDEKIGQDKNMNGISSFLVQSTRFALEFVVAFASIYTTVRLCKSRQQNVRLQREEVAHVDSRVVDGFLLTDSSFATLDVFCGKG